MPRGRGRDPEAGPKIPSPEADELVVQARAGDADAFAALYRSALPIIYGNLYRRCGDRTLAEDLTSESFLRAVRSLDRFDGKSGDFVAWVLRISRNLFLDHVKSSRVRWEIVVSETPEYHASDDPETEVLAGIEGGRLRTALERLTPEQQEVVLLRFIEGLNIAEVAGVLGRTEGAVKAMQFRALRALEVILVKEEFAT